MKKLLSLAFSRISIVVVLIIVQIAWFAVFFIKLNAQATWLSSVFGLISLLMLLAVVGSNQNPAYKIGWIFLIGLLPLLGGLLYILLGNKRPSRAMRDKIKRAESELAPLVKQPPEIPEQLPERIRATARYIGQAGYPVYANTAVEYYKIGEDMYEAMLKDLRTAQHSIFFEYFIVAESGMWRGICDILTEKARQGLDVRVMYDDMGCVGVLPRRMKQELEASGVKVVVFNPLVPFLSLVMNNRDHRKILVIDGKIGYNGGINIADEYINIRSPYGHWKDTGVRLEGEAVWNLTIMFLGLWNAFADTDICYDDHMPQRWSEGEWASDGWVLPFSDSPLDDETVSENVYMELLWQAKDYVYIFTPYLIIDHEMNVALSMAAKRGVDVRLVVPGIPDKKSVYQLTQSYFEGLIQAGVKIYLYTPGFLHAKSYLCDDEFAVVGTINMDYRSLYLHFECGTLLIGCAALRDLKQDYLDVFAAGRLVTLNDLDTRWHQRLYRAVLRVASPLF